jgi:hypothetical protein
MNEDDIVQDDLSEEGLGDIIKEQDRKLKERYDEINYRNNRLRQSQQRQRALDNRGLTDDQIREKIKEQDAQRAKENLPSQSPGERRKQQKDMEEGDFLQDPEINSFNQNLRFGAGLLVEIFGNVGLDALQVASVLTGPKGLAATTAIQASGSSFFNYLNQKIRGEKTINKGEMTAAAAASLLPGYQPFKAATKAGRFYKGILRGGTTGVIDITGTKLGRGEEVTPTDIVAGFGMGGTIGSIYGIKDGGEAFKALKNKINRGTAFVADELNLDGTISRIVPEEPLEPTTFLKSTSDTTGSNPNFGGDGGFFKRVVQKAFRNKATFPSLFVDPVTLKPKRGFTNFEMASAYDRYIDNLAKKSGYKSLADFKVQVLDTLGPNDKMNLFRQLQDGDNLRTGYIEHMVAKASKKGRLERIRRTNPVLAEDEGFLAQELSRKSRDTYDMDWYWDETYIDSNGVTRPGLNKGDRDASRNVRINFNNRYKALKDVTEQVLYGTEADPGIGLLTNDLKNRLIVSIEDIDKRSFTFNRTQLGDVVIRRAGDNKLVGKLGNYLDVLYPQNNNARSLLEQNAIQQINPNTGKKFTSLDDFRDYMIRDRIEFIVDELPKLSRKSNRQRQLIIDEALAGDIAKMYEDFPFLPKPKYISEITDKALDQNVKPPIPTKTETIQQTIKGISGLPGGG